MGDAPLDCLRRKCVTQRHRRQGAGMESATRSHRHSAVQIEHDPEAAADHEENENGGEHDRHQVLPRRGGQIQVEEIAQVDEHLDGGGHTDDDQRGRLGQRVECYQCERNGRQDQGQRKADEVGSQVAIDAGEIGSQAAIGADEGGSQAATDMREAATDVREEG